MKTLYDDTVEDRFFAPLYSALARAKSRRHCPEFTDREFLEAGVGRVIAAVQSGREWVQQMQMQKDSRINVANFFLALKSPRRLRLLEEVAQDLREGLDTSTEPGADPLAANPELEDFALYASDGHYEEASAHAERIAGKKYAPGYFFSLNLRSHSLALLDVARPKRRVFHV
jgi:hypothetical protein